MKGRLDIDNFNSPKQLRQYANTVSKADSNRKDEAYSLSLTEERVGASGYSEKSSGKNHNIEGGHHANTFLELLQTSKDKNLSESTASSGTLASPASLKKGEKDKTTTFSIELSELGLGNVTVIQKSGVVEVVIELADKSKIPANPLMFNGVVKKLLGNQFGKNFEVKVL